MITQKYNNLKNTTIFWSAFYKLNKHLRRPASPISFTVDKHCLASTPQHSMLDFISKLILKWRSMNISVLFKLRPLKNHLCDFFKRSKKNAFLYVTQTDVLQKMFFFYYLLSHTFHIIYSKNLTIWSMYPIM